MARSFHRICATHGLRPINVHHVRHTTATLLKNLGVPARDAQLILGHSRLAVTLEIYTHEDREAQRDALGRISDALRGDSTPETTVNWCQSRVSSGDSRSAARVFYQVELRRFELLTSCMPCKRSTN